MTMDVCIFLVPILLTLACCINLVTVCTVVWEEFVVGNICEKKFCGKLFHLSRLRPLQTALFICGNKILCV